MRYNKIISDALDNLPNNVCRLSEDVNSKSYIFDNQIECAKQIVKSFTAHIEPEYEDQARNNHVCLVAKMQSGKTGTCNALINILQKPDFSYFGIKKFMYITGMNDTGLHNQTVKRLKVQVFNATDESVVDGDKEKNKKDATFYVNKNSDLRKNNLSLNNSLLLIDESDFGSDMKHILTQFLTKNGIDWKNRECLEKKKIYIVSVSATPFDEIISDIAECKCVIQLQTLEGYYGVSEFLEYEMIEHSQRSDFKENAGKMPIITYIEDSLNRMDKNDGKGVLFIRTSDSSKIKKNSLIDKFNCIELKSSPGKNIDYLNVEKSIRSMIDAKDGTETSKPIIFFIKGAFRAGVSIDPEFKNYIYLVYDNSDKPRATAQGLLGRMCGYRDDINKVKNTKFYVNLQHAEDYAEWEKDFNIRENIPSSRKWIIDGTNTIKGETKIASRCIGNIEIPITDSNLERIQTASQDIVLINRDFMKSEIRLLNNKISFDCIGETYISGKNTYADSIISKWYDKFNIDSYCPSYRGNGDLDNKDIGKIFIHVVLDDVNKKLLVYRGELVQMVRQKNHNVLIKEHKKTSLELV